MSGVSSRRPPAYAGFNVDHDHNSAGIVVYTYAHSTPTRTRLPQPNRIIGARSVAQQVASTILYPNTKMGPPQVPVQVGNNVTFDKPKQAIQIPGIDRNCSTEMSSRWICGA